MQVSCGEIFINFTFFGGFLVSKVFDTLSSLKMVFNQKWFSLCVNPLESVRTVSIHVSEAVRSTSV
jgi:hypothetical protein